MKKTFVVFLIFSLFACANSTYQTSKNPSRSKDKPYQAIPWKYRQINLSSVKNWKINGNLAIRGLQNKGVNASFNWQQVAHSYQLSFFGPFGTNRTLLFGTPTSVCLITSQGTTRALQPEQLLQHCLGVTLPVSWLYYWIRGLPAPQARYTFDLDTDHRLHTLRQAGWIINYKYYTSVGNNDMPELLELFNPTWRIRIHVNQWSLD